MTYFFSKSNLKYVILLMTTRSSCDTELGMVISNLKYDMTNILDWFRSNSMKANPDKFQFMILEPSDDDKCFILKINAIEIRNTTEVIVSSKVFPPLSLSQKSCPPLCFLQLNFKNLVSPFCGSTHRFIILKFPLTLNFQLIYSWFAQTDL